MKDKFEHFFNQKIEKPITDHAIHNITEDDIIENELNKQI